MDKLNRKNLVLATAILTALIMIIALFVLKIGVSDNGMQYKLLEKLGLYDVQQTFGTGYYSNGFGVADKSFSKTSYGLMYDIAKLFTEVDSVVSTTIPALLYMLLIVGSAMLIVFSLYSDKFKAMNITACLLFVVMFCDSAYTAYLNTPYKNAAFFTYAIAMVALFLYTVKTKKIWALVLYGIFGCLFANTSTVAALSAVLLGIYSIRLIFVNKSSVWKIVSALLSVAIILTGIMSVYSDVGDMYDSVFCGAASEDASAIEKLGLDQELNVYANVSSFEEKAQEFINSNEYEEKFSSKVSIGSITGYYLKNIPQFYKGMKKVGYNATAIRTAYLSGFTASSGKSGENTGFFTAYSTVKEKVFPSSLISYLVVLIGLIVVSFIYRSSYAKGNCQKVISEFCAIFALCTLLTYPVPYILNGMNQIGFNMFSFNVMFDISLFMLIMSAINLLMTKRNILKEKYGVNQ